MPADGLYLIGLTGNIACGKSTVVRMLVDCGAFAIDADAVTHQLQAPGMPVYEAIVAHFGREVLLPAEASGQPPLDRKRLGAIVFSDAARLRELEAMVHPAVHRAIWDWIGQVQAQVQVQGVPQRQAVPVAVIDAVKLLESGWREHVQQVWVVACRVEQQIHRLMTTRGMCEAEARQRIAAQPPQATRIAQADVVIDNSESLTFTRQQVRHAWQHIQQKGREHGRA